MAVMTRLRLKRVKALDDFRLEMEWGARRRGVSLLCKRHCSLYIDCFVLFLMKEQ